MANVITSPVYDPITTATNLATSSVAAQKAQLTAQNTLANNTSTALNNLKSAISTFQSAMTAMTTSKSVLNQSATFPTAAFGTATAGVNAVAGTYSFFVEQLATASQNSYSGLSSVNTADGTGSLKVKIGDGVGDNTLDIDLGAADKDGNGILTPQEIAASINGNSKNNTRVTASIITIGNQAQLVLTSNLTGVENAVTLDASSVANTTLKNALIDPANLKEVVKAQDAIVWLGSKDTGTKIEQASNTYTNVQDVKITFARAMTVAESPVTLTVATDKTATAENVQKFVDAYNKLKTVLDGLMSNGDAAKGVAAGIFTHDSGLNALRSGMGNALRLVVDGESLVGYGITAQRDGSLSLDSTKLATKLAANPTGLDKLFGNNSMTASSGVLGGLDKLLGQWTNSTGGQIKQRLEATDNLQKNLNKNMDRLNNQYDMAYKRFLDQFTRLQILQEQMNKNVDMFDAMFGNDKS